MKKKSRSCPVCGESFGPLTYTRTVTLWKDLASDERMSVLVATCAGCGSEYEQGAKTTKAMALPLPTGNPAILGVILGTLLLSLINGILSLELTGTAGLELNPVLGFYQQIGAVPFILVKYGLTFAPLLMLFLFQDRFFFNGRIQGRQLLMAVPVPYMGVVAYSLLLLDN
ncbi:MAG TPA: DUF5658 family protein, partial [Acidobacteriota bacterium]|nr:DUF5658 family protein [Acidobacteriota bacterium]